MIVLKNKTFFNSIKCAINGIICAYKTERNFKFYFLILFLFFCLDLYIGVDVKDYIFIVITVMGVFSSECINTSIEHFIDMIDKDIKPEIKIIKDIAASGVLCWGIAFFVCQILILLTKEL